MDEDDQDEALTEVPRGNMMVVVMGKMEVAQAAQQCMRAEWGVLGTAVTGLGTEAEWENNWGMVPSAKTDTHQEQSIRCLKGTQKG